MQAAQDITLSKSSVALTEGGGTQTYNVKLPNAPTGNVTVTVASGDTGAVTLNPSSLTFTTTNYNTNQQVTLTPVGDADGADESVTITHSAAGGGYDNKSATLTATVADDDRGLTLSPASLTLDEGATGKSVTVALAAEPAGTVTLSIVYPSAEVSLSATTLSFTTANWSTPQSVTVSGKQDTLSNLNEWSIVEFRASGGDYLGTTGSVNVIVLDDDTGSPDLALSTSSLTLTEGGGASTFTVAFSGPLPRRVFNVSIASSDTGAVTVNPGSLTFLGNNYTTAQTVTVTPVDDNDSGNESVTVTASVTNTNDSGYQGEAGSVAVTVTDNELGLAASAVKETTATLTISNHTAAWWYKGDQSGAQCTSVAANTATANLTGLTGGTSYTYKAYSDSACTTEITNASTDAEFSTVGLTATSVTQTTATLNLANWTAAWWHKKTVPTTPAGTCTAVAANTATAALTSLTAGTAHTWEVYSATGCSSSDKIADVDFTTTAAATLAASAVKETTATLTIAGHTAAWWHKGDQTNASCTSVAANTSTASLSGLTGGTDYTYKAYSDSACTTEITNASTDAEFSTVGLTATPVAQTTATLNLANWTAAWWHNKTSGPGTATCTSVAASTATASLSSLTVNSAYTWTVYSAAGCASANKIADVDFTTPPVSLAASAVKETTATLTIAGHAAAWWHKGDQSGAQCTSVAASTSTASLTGLTGGTDYTYKAYSDSACTTEITSASTDAEFSTVGLTATSVTQTGATLNLANWTAAWWHNKTSGPGTASCTSVAANTATASLSSLTINSSYAWTVYSAANCNAADKIADVDLSTAAATLAASAVKETTASLTIAGHTAAWWHKGDQTNASCTSVAANTATANLSGLTGGTDYTYKAYSDSACTTEITSASTDAEFSTVGLTATSVTQTGATLNLANWTAAWWHNKTSGPGTASCTSVAANTTTASLSSLTINSSYAWTVYSAANCNAADKIADVDFTTAAATLAASAVKETTATLTIAGHAAAWWHKGDQTNASCTSVAANTSTASLSGLTGGTDYTYKAYSDSACTTEITTASTDAEFSTVGLTATSVTQTGATLNLANWTAAWWHNKTSGPGTATCTSVAANTTTASLSSLTANSSYAFAVYSASGCASADKIADVDFATAAATLAASAVKETTATLTIAGHAAAWWHKGDQTNASCTSVAASTSTASLTNLTGGTDYTYKAYSDSACTTEITSASTDADFSTVGLAAGSITQTTATLNLANWTAAWWHNKTSGPGTATCTSVAANTTTASLSSLTVNSGYAWAVYSASGCASANKIADVDFSTAAVVSLTASNVKETTATLTLSNWTAAWWYRQTAGAGGSKSCTAVSANTPTASVSGLGGYGAYTYKAYSDSACATEITTDSTDAEFGTVGLIATSVTASGATLKLRLWSAPWWHNKTSGPGTASCMPVAANTISASVTGLLSISDYTWEVYSAAGCNSADKIADVDFTTPAVWFGASAVKETTATLTIGGYTAAWWYKGSQGGAQCTAVAQNIATANLSGLTGGTDYTYKAYSDSACATEITTASTDAEFTTVRLTANPVAQTTATLNLSNWAAAWWHNKTAGPGTTSCTSVSANTATASLSSLTVSSSYTWTVYSAANCNASDKIADVDFGTSTVSLAASAVEESTATLTIAGHTTAWWYKGSQTNASCTSVAANTATASLSGLTGGTDHTYKAYSNSTCTTELTTASTDAEFSTVGLTATSVTQTGATLNLSNWTAAWWHNKTSGPGTTSCASVAANTATANLPTLAANTSYTWTAYSASSCASANKIADVDLTTLPWVGGTDGLSSDRVTETTATLRLLSSHTGPWWYKRTLPSGDNTCHEVASSADTASLTGLTGGTRYRYTAYSNNTCTTELTRYYAQFQTPSMIPTAVTWSATTVTLEGWHAAWWHKKTAGPGTASCASAPAHVAGTTKLRLSGLTANSSYAWEAYSAENCNSSDKLADTAFTTASTTTSLDASAVTGSTATLTLSNWVAAWWHKKTSGPGTATCTPVAASIATASLSGLTANSSYAWAAYSATGCDSSTKIADAAFSTVGLTASSVTHNSATLTISNRSGNWWLKRTTPADTTCKSKGTTATESLSSLSSNTDYTYKAYSDSACSAELTSESLLTKPGKPTKPVAAAGAGSGKLTVTASVTGGGTLTKWQYVKKEGSSNFETTWTDITETSISLSHTVSGLTDGTNYQFKVRAVNATGNGADSDASDATAPADKTLTASSVTHNSATLTIGNHPGNWWLKRTTPADTTCKSKGTTATESLTSLSSNTNYTYKAYSDSSCSTELAAETLLTKPGKPTKPAAAAGAGSGKLTVTATVTGSGTLTGWQYKQKEGTGNFDADWTDISETSTSLSHTVTGLTDGTSYQFKVRAANATGNSADSDASTAAAPADETLTASSVEAATATLAIGNWTGDWYYQYTSPTGGTCSTNAVTTTSVDLANLSANTSYTYKAYSDSGCGTELASASAFLTKPGKPTKPVAAAGAGSGKLTVTASVTGGGTLSKWQYVKKEGSSNFETTWTDITETSTSLSHTVSGLTDGTSYQFKVRAVNATGTGADSDASTAAAPADETLTASSVTHNSATLTIGHHPGSWWLKRTTPADTTCKSKGTTATESLSSLSTNTDYTYKAYSDSTCSTELASESFLTKPGKPTKPAAAAGAGSGKLTVTASVTGAGTLSKWQYVKKEGSNSFETTWTDITETSTSLTHTVTGLTDGTSYQFKVRAVNGTGTGADSDASTAAAPADETLTASSVEAATATLTIGNHSGDWYYKANAAPHASCSSSAVSGTTKDLTGLSGNTSYTYTAYSDSGCGTELATASAFLTKPGKPTRPVAASGGGSGTLTLTASVAGSATLTKWQYKQKEGTGNFDANWTNIASTAKSLNHDITGLTDGTSYQYKVRAVNATGNGADSDASTAAAPADETLTASSVTHNSATLTIGNWTGDWYYRYTVPTGGSCSTNAVTTTSVDLTNLSTNTDYTYKAYSDSGCNTEVATETLLTKPGKPTKPVAASGTGSGKLTVTASVTGSGTLTGWEIVKKEGSSNFETTWADVSSTSTSLNHTVANLTDGTSYQFKVRAVNATGTGADSDASTAIAPADETLNASGVEVATATLTIGNHTGNWYYKANAAPHASCSSSAVTGTTKDLTGLSGNTSYTYTAYSDSGCGTELASASAFLTKPGKPTKPVAASGGGSGTLTLTASVAGSGTLTKWQYKQKEGTGNFDADWTDITSTATSLNHDITGLTDGTSYQYKVRAVNATGNGADSDASTAVAPADETLTAGSVEATTATLTIGNHTGNWHYKADAAPHASCSSSAVSTTSVDLTGLSGNTSYTYTAYSDSSCGTELASASAFLTKPGKPAKPTASPGAGSGKLTLASSVAGSGALSKWQYQRKAGNGNFGSWTDIASTSTSLTHTVTGLTGGTNYQFKVRAVNATGEGAASDASDAAQPVTVTLAATAHASDAAKATLSIGSWSGAWHYRANGAPDASCSSAVSGGSADLAGLSANTSYVYRAYSDAGCTTANLLATAGAYLTKPGKPTKPAAASGAGSGRLTVTASVTGTGALSKWQYVKKEGTGDFEAAWTDMSSTSTSLTHTVTGLTDGTSYQFKVRAVNAAGNGPASDASDAAGPTRDVVDQTPSFAAGAAIADRTYMLNAAIEESVLPEATGGDGTLTYTLAPALPAGLGFDPATRLLSGTPTRVSAAATYTYTATDADATDPDSASLTFSLAVASEPSFGANDAIDDMAFTQDVAIEPHVLPAATGGNGALTYALSPAPPAGLTFDAATRTLAGAPTEVSAGIEYAYAVVDGAGNRASLTFVMSVAAANSAPAFPPGAAIAGLALVQNAAMEPHVLPEARGGDGTLTYAVAPELPPGLAFDAATRTLSGAPTEPSEAATYDYTVTDADGDAATLTFELAVAEDLAPTFGDASIGDGDGSTPALTFTQNAPVAPLTLPEASGGDGPLTYALTPALPAGLTFDPATRTLRGTPAEASEAVRYTYTATDSDASDPDSASLDFTLAVDPDLRPAFADGAAIADLTLAQNAPVAPLALPEASGGDGALTYALTPALPPGLTFDPATRTLAGTPTEASEAVRYTYTATDADAHDPDSASLNFTLAVDADLKPAFADGAAIADLTLAQNAPVAPLALPEASGGDGALTYALTPALPPGLTFDPATRTLSGTPAEASEAVRYRYTATDSDANDPDSASLNFTLAVDADLKPTFAAGAAIADLRLTQNAPVAPLALPEASGGDGALTYALTPALPPGLTFDPATRTLAGTPVEPAEAARYTYTATDADANDPDSASLNFTLAVAPDLKPSFAAGAAIADLTLTQNAPVAPLALPEASGGDGTLTYALTPALPPGLTFDPATRTFAGTPAQAAEAAPYTYTATDSDANDPDSASLNFTLAVDADLKPTFAAGAAIADLRLTQNAPVAPLALPEASGGDGALTYALTPALPPGLTFDPATRTLAGTPAQAAEAAPYRYTATDADANDPDSASLTFTLAVAPDLKPTFAAGAAIADLRLTQNAPVAPLALPEASGGDGALTYALTPALPPGLTFDPATRTLAGTPAQAAEAVRYTYTATDADAHDPDSASLNFTLAVDPDQKPSFADGAAIADLRLAQNAPVAPLALPEASGGDGALTYALTPALPPGLTFDPATRTLAGTPAQAAEAVRYTYTATDADAHDPDSASLNFALAVAPDRKPTFAEGAAIADQTFTQRFPIDTLTLPEASGGDGALTYSLAPALPAGLAFDPAARTLSGTPMEPFAAATFAYAATDADGNDPDSATLRFVIAVVADAAPSFGDQRIPSLSLRRGQAMVPLVLPDAAGGNGALTYSLSPALPAGLDFDATTRVLSGTPTAVGGARTYEYAVVDSDPLEPDVATLAFTIEVTASVADEAVLNDALAAQGRAMLTSAATVIGERFKGGAATSPPCGAGGQDCSSAVLGWLGRTLAAHAPRGGTSGSHAFGSASAPVAWTWGAGGMQGPTRGDPEANGSPWADVGAGASMMDGSAWGRAGMSAPLRGRAGMDGSMMGGLGGAPGLGADLLDWRWDSLVLGRSFAMGLGAAPDRPARWTVWGAGDLQSFNGAVDAGRHDGELRTFYLGADRAFGASWLVGAAVARGSGKANYSTADLTTGALDTSLTALHPYVRGTFASGLEVWAIGGFGRGEADIAGRSLAGDGSSADLDMAMAAFGLRRGLFERGGLAFAAVGSAGFLTLATAAGDELGQGLAADVRQARLALEASIPASGLAPYLQVGGRHDGGDGRTGMGVELAAGIRHQGPRLDFEVRGRWLTADDYDEYGAMARLELKSRDDGTGWTAALSPVWGEPMGGALLGGDLQAGALGMAGDLPYGGNGGGALATMPTRLSVEGELGYAVRWPRTRGLVRPMLLHGSGASGNMLGMGLAYRTLAKQSKHDVSLQAAFGMEQRLGGEGGGNVLLRFSLRPRGSPAGRAHQAPDAATERRPSAPPAIAKPPLAQAAPPTPARLAVADRDRLLELPETHYAVQLMAMRTVAELDRYVAKHGLQDALRVAIDSDGRALHVLILGVHADRDEARRAAADLAARLPGIAPWVRELGPLQRAIRDAAGA